MKVEHVLKIKYSPFETYEEQQIIDIENKWIEEYQKIIHFHPEKTLLCNKLIERIHMAKALFIKKYIHVKKINNYTYGYYNEYLGELEEEENQKFNGDFPLGNDLDISFVIDAFSINEIVLIQCGLHNQIVYVKTNTEYDLIHNGFLLELQRKYHDAITYYEQVKKHRFIKNKLFQLYRKINKTAIKINVRKANKDDDASASKFFASAYIPDSMKELLHDDLIFFAQIRLKDIDDYDINYRLPHYGTLYVFFDTKSDPYTPLIIHSSEKANVVIDDYNYLNQAYMMDFELVDDHYLGTKLFGEATTIHHQQSLFLQFNQTDFLTPFIKLNNNYFYLQFSENPKAFDRIILVLD